jgi:hypothetical protein
MNVNTSHVESTALASTMKGITRAVARHYGLVDIAKSIQSLVLFIHAETVELV